jgi:hypothetical protein
METQGQNDTSHTQLDQYGDADDTPTRQHQPGKTQLDPYEDDEVVTAPWGPRAT